MTQATDPVITGTSEPDVDPAPDHVRALLADLADLAAVINPDGSLRYLNRAGRRLLSVHPEADLHTITPVELLSDIDHLIFERDIEPALESDGWWTGSISLVTAAGHEVPTRSTVRLHPATPSTPAAITWVARDISTEKAVYERLHKKIFEDELTGLPHRSTFLDRIDLAMRRTDPGDLGVELLFVSLDRFKEKNDRFGREVGDVLLREVAGRLQSIDGPGVTVSRWGGDEFVILCDALGVDDDPMTCASQVIDVFQEPFSAGDVALFQTASVGVTVARGGEMTTDQLLRQAEAASQMAKVRGGGVAHRFDEEMRARALRRAEVEDSLRGAVTRGELVVHYQPEVNLRTNEIVAVESLVRWHHPTWGLVAPTEFVPVAEASNLIVAIGTFVLTSAMEQCAAWRLELGDRAPMVAINISARQFLQDDFVGLVASILERTGADPSDICLEITESVLMDDIDVTLATLQRLKALGLYLAVDDFGTGYSSLSYLRRFPVDILKVDQSFVSGLGYDPEDSAIVQAVVHMGRALQLTTVAEGVETAHHLIELRELDCDIGQGYHFARPSPAETITALLHAGPDWMRQVV